MRFHHASASRGRACSVVAIAHGADGTTGHGEGCPRAYVTGESTASAARFFAAHKEALECSVTGVEDLRTWIAAHRTAIDANPAAFAAIELALLDLFARRAGTTPEALLGLPPARPVAVSAVFGVTGAATAGLIATGYRAFGMVDAKVKLSSDPASDRRRIAVIRRVLGPTMRLRVDANNLFFDPGSCAAHLAALGAEIWALEEPLQPRDIDGQQKLAAITGARIILDESALLLDDLDDLQGARWIVNLRVSKHGGLLRSLAMREAAAARGLDIIIGSHVGETGLLARAALALAAACGDRLLACESGYGGYLLAHDLARPSLRFDRHGILDLERLSRHAPGLGLRVDETLLEDVPV
jgi:L-alanine-DL-glutamate epimerase-like enolase superfamily enzyme